jgi:hypothetical protein
MTTARKPDNAIQFALAYERAEGREALDVSFNKSHSGYDIRSGNRRIQVKGICEGWSTYNWQPLYKIEVDCLRSYPNEFHLYIVKFKGKGYDEVVGSYVIPGFELLDATKFDIEVETYRLSPISEKSRWTTIYQASRPIHDVILRTLGSEESASCSNCRSLTAKAVRNDNRA